jgi:hypothetical protein
MDSRFHYFLNLPLYSTDSSALPAPPHSQKHDNNNTTMDSEEEVDDNDNRGITSIITSNEMLKVGLTVGTYTRSRINAASKAKNIERFKSMYGSSPRVVALIWEDLQTTQVDAAHVLPKDRKVKYYLMALHHLKRYPPEYERERQFDINIGWSRDWCWFFIEKIQALKVEKIKWPDDNFGTDIWVLTVDGTHCWIQEPKHPTWSQDPKYFSHKYGRAGLNYELGISLVDGHLVWMKGPFKAGSNDVQIFRDEGLKAKLRATGKMAIGDGGYCGHPYQISTPNSHESKQCAKFKSRALKRHERFNGLTKAFDCLSGRFRHCVPRFKNCFEAVCVICQYQVETDSPLYSILIEELMENDEE